MNYKRILTFQDISCVGQCSLSVAMPIISACGHETCPLPSAVLSNHTGSKFSGWTFRDLTEDIMPIAERWKTENLTFDAFYSGYLGSNIQIEYAKHLIDNYLNDGGVSIVDPAMADNGVLYKGFNGEFAKNMVTLCAKADIVIPNITEVCVMTGAEYKTEYDEKYIDELIARLNAIGINRIIITGVTFSSDKLGVAVSENGKTEYYFHEKMPVMSHGTGDVYASAFTGAYMKGKSLFESAKIAADFTLLAIKATDDIKTHWYGVRFEKVLGDLINMLK